MRSDETLATFWAAFLASSAGEAATGTAYPQWGFGDSASMADELGKLVLDGRKTATASLFWAYEKDDEALPVVGDRSILTDGVGNPLCIIETVEVNIWPFNEVPPEFAAAEGEGDLSLKYWREAHWSFFGQSVNGWDLRQRKICPSSASDL